MGGNTANLLQDIRASKDKLTLTSQTVTQAHSSFTTQSTELMTLIEQLEIKFQELAQREEAVEKREYEVDDKIQLVQAREQKCTDREQKLETRERVVSEKESKWVETEKKMQQNAAKLPSYIQLSISGTRFAVSKETILQHYRESLLGQMIVSDHPPLTPTGEIFIARDPHYFRFVVRVLLDGSIKPPSSAEKRAVIEEEFAYYNIPFKCADTVNFEDEKLGSEIKEWLPGKKFTLIYKASVDGYTRADFHKWCDNKGPTLTVIRSSGGYLFGGYSSISWHSTSSYIDCADAFIFTLTNPHNIPPTKYTCRDSQYAIYNYSPYGPSFGCGCDITISGNFDQNNTQNYSSFPSSYTDTTGKKGATFTGNTYFTVQEMETFSVR